MADSGHNVLPDHTPVRLDPRDAQRYRRYLLAEWEAAALYRSLADTEPDPERAGILRELAAMEDRHGARWKEKLEAAGETLPRWSLSTRSRALGALARVAGTRAVIPILERAEGEDADMYAAEPAAQDFVSEERTHARIFARLRGDGGAGPQERILRRESWHRGGGSGALRAGVFGVNDGLVSNLSLVMGFAGAATGRDTILLAGLSGLLAGAFSMATGEYVSMRVQREQFEREIELERVELEEEPEEELEELVLIYRAKGLSEDEARRVATQMMSDKDVALDTLAREELGLDPAELGSPWAAASSSFLMFAIGAAIPVLPFLLALGQTAFFGSIILSALALMAVGGLTALLTGRSIVFGSLRMVGLGALSATVTYLVGSYIGGVMVG